MSESWEAEIQENPAPSFTLYPITTTVRNPKQQFLRYVRTVYGTDKAREIRETLQAAGITDSNFAQWQKSTHLRVLASTNSH